MKSLKIAVLLGLMSQMLLANEVPVKHQLDRVTVFIQGAQLFHKADIMLEKGEHTLIFSGLTTSLQPGSVRVGGKGSLSILSVSARVNYLDAPKQTVERENLEAQLKKIEADIEDKNLMVGVYSEEEDLLLKNKQLGGSAEGLKVEQLKLASDFIRSRLSEIRTKKLELQRAIKKQQEEAQKIRSQINQLSGNKGKAVREIVVKVAVAQQTKANFDLSYNVANASWSPVYDIRVEATNKPIKVEYKARVLQNTGVDWKNVMVTLSSGNPNLSNSLPNIYTWYVDFYREVYANQSMARDDESAELSEVVVVRGARAKASLEKNEAEDIEYVGASFNQKTINFEYALAIPYTIPSSNLFEEVHVRTEEVPAVYEYRANLRADLTAYLVAKMYGWQDFNLLSGPAKLFNEGTFVGEINLDLNNTNDTLLLSLGREDNIIIKRERVKDISGSQLIGSTQRVNRGWQTSIRNNKKQAIKLVVTDQIPVSRQKEIEVKMEKETDGKLDETTGFVTWILDLPAASTKEIKLYYSVKYPKDKPIDFRE